MSMCLITVIKVVIVFWILSFFASAEPSSNLTFYNFQQPESLVIFDNHYRFANTSHFVQLSNRIIVRTSSLLKRQTLKALHDDIAKVTPLYTGRNFTYYSITSVSSTFPLDLYKSLIELSTDKLSEINLVQPDILQIKNKSEFEKENKSIGAPYLDMLNIEEHWHKTKGKGVSVAIIDDGIDLMHPDLVGVSSTFLYDVETQTQSVRPQTKIDRHGTKVAGIIFAQHNNAGINGIAPDANLIAIRQPDTWTSNTLLSFHLAKLAGADIINCSWHSNWLAQPLSDVINDLVTYGRNGKGIAVIWAAGNKGVELVSTSHEANMNNVITVGAVDKHHQKMKFSNFGEAIDVYVFGDKTKTTIIPNRHGREYGSFSGTSLAAAVTSGLAALLLSQQPELPLAELIKQLQSITKTKQVVI